MTPSCCVETAVTVDSVSPSLSSVCVKETFLNCGVVWTDAIFCQNIDSLTVRSYRRLGCDAPTLVSRKRQKRLHITSFFLNEIACNDIRTQPFLHRWSVVVPPTCCTSGSWYRCRRPDIPGGDGHVHTIGFIAVTLHLASLLKHFWMRSVGKSWYVAAEASAPSCRQLSGRDAVIISGHPNCRNHPKRRG